jgi:peroxiredoxin
VSLRSEAPTTISVGSQIPDANTHTCSAKHVPRYVEKLSELKADGADEVGCMLM